MRSRRDCIIRSARNRELTHCIVEQQNLATRKLHSTHTGTFEVHAGGGVSWPGPPALKPLADVTGRQRQHSEAPSEAVLQLSAFAFPLPSELAFTYRDMPLHISRDQFNRHESSSSQPTRHTAATESDPYYHRRSSAIVCLTAIRPWVQLVLRRDHFTNH